MQITPAAVMHSSGQCFYFVTTDLFITTDIAEFRCALNDICSDNLFSPVTTVQFTFKQFLLPHIRATNYPTTYF